MFVKQLTKQSRQKKKKVPHHRVDRDRDALLQNPNTSSQIITQQWLTAPDLQSLWQKKKTEPLRPIEEKCRILKRA